MSIADNITRSKVHQSDYSISNQSQNNAIENEPSYSKSEFEESSASLSQNEFSERKRSLRCERKQNKEKNNDQRKSSFFDFDFLSLYPDSKTSDDSETNQTSSWLPGAFLDKENVYNVSSNYEVVDQSSSTNQDNSKTASFFTRLFSNGDEIDTSESLERRCSIFSAFLASSEANSSPNNLSRS
jgi:hypothetical protein